MKFFMFFALVLGMSASAFADEKLDEIKKKAENEAMEFKTKLMGNKSWSKSIIDALKAQNKTYSAGAERKDKVPVEGIDKLDKEWTEWFKAWKLAKSYQQKLPAQTGIVKKVMESSCSKALQAAKKNDNSVSEVFIFDKLGANVCAAEATSDYDQGDEDKFLEPFNKGVNPHISNPTRDASADTFQTQVSYVIEDGKDKIGVITIGTTVK